MLLLQRFLKSLSEHCNLKTLRKDNAVHAIAMEAAKRDAAGEMGLTCLVPCICSSYCPTLCNTRQPSPRHTFTVVQQPSVLSAMPQLAKYSPHVATLPRHLCPSPLMSSALDSWAVPGKGSRQSWCQGGTSWQFSLPSLLS